MSDTFLIGAFSVIFIWLGMLTREMYNQRSKITNTEALEKSFKAMEDRVTTALQNFDLRQGAFMRTYIDELKSFFKDIKIQ